jgi:hypothetical protein
MIDVSPKVREEIVLRNSPKKEVNLAQAVLAAEEGHWAGLGDKLAIWWKSELRKIATAPKDNQRSIVDADLKGLRFFAKELSKLPPVPESAGNDPLNEENPLATAGLRDFAETYFAQNVLPNAIKMLEALAPAMHYPPTTKSGQN